MLTLTEGLLGSSRPRSLAVNSSGELPPLAPSTSVPSQRCQHRFCLLPPESLRCRSPVLHDANVSGTVSTSRDPSPAVDTTGLPLPLGPRSSLTCQTQLTLRPLPIPQTRLLGSVSRSPQISSSGCGAHGSLSLDLPVCAHRLHCVILSRDFKCTP